MKAEEILTINLNDVPVVATDRSMPRKLQAAAARKLFKSLGINGISIRAERYVGAKVQVGIPKVPGRITQRLIDRKIRAILDKAFPNHVDRSDWNTDYFDYKWTFGEVPVTKAQRMESYRKHSESLTSRTESVDMIPF